MVRPARRAPWILATILAAATSVAAQTPPGPPGPYILDVRGTTISLPEGAVFFPAVSTGAIVPARAFGVDAGGHVYFATWRAARIGLGAGALYARGTALDVNTTLAIIAPQLSLNFGTADGWSHLSAGLGAAHLASRLVTIVTTTPTTTTTSETTSESTADDPNAIGLTVRALNFGGGARWFFKPRMAVGFDIRFYKLAGGTTTPGRRVTQGTMLFAASAGLSFR